MTSRAAIIDSILSEVRNRRTSIDRNWTAGWLLSPITATKWLIRKKGTVLVDGRWTNAMVINWTDRLPDGSRLHDAQNKIYLATLQKLAFLIREEACDIRSSYSFINYVSILKALTQWIFRNHRRFAPATFGLSMLDEKAVLSFANSYIAGGLFEVCDYANRFLKQVAPDAYLRWKRESKSKDSYFHLPGYLVTEVSVWLADNHFYRVTSGRGPTRGLRYVNRNMVCEILQTDLTTLNNSKVTAFFRQFEPDYIAKFPDLAVRSSAFFRQCLSQRTVSIEAAATSKAGPAQISAVISVLTGLQQISAEVPLSIPPFPSSNQKSAFNSLFLQQQPSRHTPWIPLDIAMTYLNESLRWVVHYGRPLIDFYVRSMAHFKEKGWLHSLSRDDSEEKCRLREQWFAANLPTELIPLGLTGWQINTGPGIPPAERFSFSEAMNILIGAATYLITNLAPSRATEISHLEKRCLEFKDGDGFWLRKRRGKNVESDQYGEMNIPVPRAVALAIGLLRDLGSKSRTFSLNYHSAFEEYLFYLPQFLNSTIPPMKLREKRDLNFALDLFADHVALPPDEHGRRWYPRIHENRKSFLLTLIWSFKYAALDTARMLAGHTDMNHILAYIKANFPGAEISELEADYLAETLWDFGVSQKRETHNVRNISALYRRVCAHFKVREISEVSHKDLKDYLDLTLSEGSYVVDVIDIVTTAGKHTIALKIRFTKA